MRELLASHPLISPIEVGAAFDMSGTEEVRALAAPIIDAGKARILEVPGGWFLAAPGVG